MPIWTCDRRVHKTHMRPVVCRAVLTVVKNCSKLLLDAVWPRTTLRMTAEPHPASFCRLHAVAESKLERDVAERIVDRGRGADDSASVTWVSMITFEMRQARGRLLMRTHEASAQLSDKLDICLELRRRLQTCWKVQLTVNFELLILARAPLFVSSVRFYFDGSILTMYCLLILCSVNLCQHCAYS